MTIYDLIEQAKVNTYVSGDRVLHSNYAKITLANGDRFVVRLSLAQGRTTALRPHWRANFYRSGKLITKTQAIEILAKEAVA
jgi:hypothetical protein